MRKLKQVVPILIKINDNIDVVVTEDGYFLPASELDGDMVVSLMLDDTPFLDIEDSGVYWFDVLSMSIDALNILDLDEEDLKNMKKQREKFYNQYKGE